MLPKNHWNQLLESNFQRQLRSWNQLLIRMPLPTEWTLLCLMSVCLFQPFHLSPPFAAYSATFLFIVRNGDHKQEKLLMLMTIEQLLKNTSKHKKLFILLIFLSNGLTATTTAAAAGAVTKVHTQFSHSFFCCFSISPFSLKNAVGKFWS